MGQPKLARLLGAKCPHALMQGQRPIGKAYKKALAKGHWKALFEIYESLSLLFPLPVLSKTAEKS